MTDGENKKSGPLFESKYRMCTSRREFSCSDRVRVIKYEANRKVEKI